jgi:hypothetical protein
MGNTIIKNNTKMKKLILPTLAITMFSCQKDLEEPTPAPTPAPVIKQYVAQISDIGVTNYAAWKNSTFLGEPFFMAFGVQTNDTITVKHSTFSGTIRIHLDGQIVYSEYKGGSGQKVHTYIVP